MSFHRTSRFAAASAVSTGSLAWIFHSKNYSLSDTSSWPFDTKGFKSQSSFHTRRGNQNLALAAVGMRRKNLYVVDVDVYLVGLSLAPGLVHKAKEWFHAHNDSALVETLMGLPNDDNVRTPDDESPKILITLKFVRDVTVNQITQAFIDSFKGCNSTTIADFIMTLKEVAGSNGFKNGEELNFYWKSGGGLIVLARGNEKHVKENHELEERLLEVYLNPRNPIAPDLLTSFERNIDAVDNTAANL